MKLNNTINVPEDIDSILLLARKVNASDIHIIPGKPIYFRIEGSVIGTNRIVNEKNIYRLVNDLDIPDAAYGRLCDTLTTDFSYERELIGRFRVNVTRLGTSHTLSIRPIDTDIRHPLELGFHQDLIDSISKTKSGLVIFTGTTSSGKSTSLSGMLKYCMGSGKHVITLNNPIEAVYDIEGSLLTQLEYGRDFNSFTKGVEICMRKDPDIISIAELRDVETIRAAVLAADTGHLVLGTCHTRSIDETVNRIIGAFSGEDMAYMERLTKSVLRLVVSQELVFNNDLGRRELLYEYREM